MSTPTAQVTIQLRTVASDSERDHSIAHRRF